MHTAMAVLTRCTYSHSYIFTTMQQAAKPQGRAQCAAREEAPMDAPILLLTALIISGFERAPINYPTVMN